METIWAGRTKDEWVYRARCGLMSRGCQNTAEVAKVLFYEYWKPDPHEAAQDYVIAQGLSGQVETPYR